MFGTDAATKSILGVTWYGATVSPLQAILAEAIGTFILVFTIYGVAVDPRAPVGWAGLVIGLIVAGIIFVVGPVTGAALNPARAFGTTFVQATSAAKPSSTSTLSTSSGQCWAACSAPSPMTTWCSRRPPSSRRRPR